MKSAAIFQARKVVADVWHLSSCFIKNVCALTFGFKTDNRALRIYKFVKPQEKYCFSFFYLLLPKMTKWCLIKNHGAPNAKRGPFLGQSYFLLLRPGVENLKVLTRGILITFCCCHNCQNLSMFTLFVWLFLCLPKLPKYKKHSFQLAKLYLTASYCQTETNVAGDTKEGPDSFILTVFVKLAWKQIRLRQIP